MWEHNYEESMQGQRSDDLSQELGRKPVKETEKWGRKMLKPS